MVALNELRAPLLAQPATNAPAIAADPVTNDADKKSDAEEIDTLDLKKTTIPSYSHIFVRYLSQQDYPSYFKTSAAEKESTTKAEVIGSSLNFAEIFSKFKEDPDGVLVAKVSNISIWNKNGKEVVNTKILLRVLDAAIFLEKNAPNNLKMLGFEVTVENDLRFVFKSVNRKIYVIFWGALQWLGEGGDGKVAKVIEMTEGRLCAVKFNKIAYCKDCIKDEYDLVMSLKTDHKPYHGFVNILFCQYVSQHSFNVMSLYDGNLSELNKRDHFKSDFLAIIDCCQQLIDAVAELHRRDGCHRDLKKHNILYKQRMTDKSVIYTFYLSDFARGITKKFQKHTLEHSYLRPTAGTYTSLDCVDYGNTIKTKGLDQALFFFQMQDVYALGLVLKSLLKDNADFSSILNKMQNHDPQFRPNMEMVATEWQELMKSKGITQMSGKIDSAANGSSAVAMTQLRKEDAADTIAKTKIVAIETPSVLDLNKQNVQSYKHIFKDLITQKLFPHLFSIFQKEESSTKEADVKENVDATTVARLKDALQYYHDDISGNLYLRQSNEKLKLSSEHLLKIFDLVFFFQKQAPKYLANQGCYALIEQGRQFLFRKINNKVRIVQVYNYNERGSGGEAHIYKVIDITKGRFRAMRVPIDNTCLSCFMDAYKVIRALRKPNVYPGFVKVLMTTTCNAETPTIMMPLYDGSLESCMTDISSDNRLRRDCCEQLIEIVSELHRRNVAHRDIKARNFLFKCTGLDPFLSYQFYLSDFGNSACKEVPKHAHKAEQEYPPKGTYSEYDSINYTETIKEYGVDEAIKRFQRQDVYALGIVLDSILRAEDKFVSVAKTMQNRAPSSRPSMQQVLLQWHTIMKRGAGPNFA